MATGSKPLRKDGASARIEIRVEAQSATPVPTEAMNSQPCRIAPSVARARAKWRIPTQLPSRPAEAASSIKPR